MDPLNRRWTSLAWLVLGEVSRFTLWLPAAEREGAPERAAPNLSNAPEP